MPRDTRVEATGRGVADPVSWTPREIEIRLLFGVDAAGPDGAATWPAEANVGPGRLTLVTGPSGSGKSSLLRAFERGRPESGRVESSPFPTDVCVADAVAAGEPLSEALRLLTACGLGEPRLWLRRIGQLSDGEQWRARLARAIGQRRRQGAGAPLLCDDFAAGLHRRAAQAVAFNLRKLATRERLTVVVATAHGDIESDLQPDTVVRLSPDGSPAVERPGARRARPTFASGLRIEEGTLRDYEAMADLHYRGGALGCVDRVYVMRAANGECLGVAVYGYAPLELALRNEATGGRYSCNAARLNAEVRILRRLVVHPDVRGCGLGRWLVAETLRRVGTAHVECLAAMGLVNPVFERAGMERVGLCGAAPSTARALERLRAMGVDPLSAEFVGEACRRPAVRRVLLRAVADWYRGSTADGAERARRQEPSSLARTFRQLAGSRSAYYLWSRGSTEGIGGAAAGAA